MRNIRASAHHLSRLISDVLDLASSQAGELRLTCKPLNLREVLEEAVVLGELIVQEKGLAWRTTIPQHLPVIRGDRTRLRQVILNLVSNAVKFTERGGVSLSVEVGERAVTVSVSDTGLGIPAEEQQAIFDEFRRSERAVARGYGGIGLGLAITRRVIEMHGGQIGVAQPARRGQAHFLLHAAGDGGGGGHAETTQPRPQTVLLLTEHAGGSERIAPVPHSRGFEVEVLVTAEHADWFAQVVASPPGAVVFDFQPAANRGWELMQADEGEPGDSGCAGRVLRIVWIRIGIDSGYGPSHQAYGECGTRPSSRPARIGAGTRAKRAGPCWWWTMTRESWTCTHGLCNRTCRVPDSEGLQWAGSAGDDGARTAGPGPAGLDDAGDRVGSRYWRRCESGS